MLSYIYISTLTWTILAIFYSLFLRHEKYFTYNRIFLIASLILGLIVPLVPQFGLVSGTVFSNITANLPEITITNKTNAPTASNNYNFGYIFLIIYLFGLIYFFFNLFKSLVSLKNHYNRGEKTRFKNYQVVKTEGSFIAFSFFNTIFINKNLYNSKKKAEILLHESVHVKQGHSYDVLFLEILKVVFWFNPIIHFYRSFLSETHEYIADNHVIQKISKKTYGELLINQLHSGVQYKIANYFINSLIKNRIKMMYKTKSNRKWKYLIVFPVLIFVLLFANACQQNETKKDQSEQTIYKMVEEMPRFPGCEAESTKKEKDNCSTKKMYNYIYNHLIYPEKAIKNGIQGKVTVRFVVDNKGNIENPKILKNIGGGCGDEVIKVLESMNHLPQKWTPGKQNGKEVSVYYTLPVVFKLMDKE